MSNDAQHRTALVTPPPQIPPAATRERHEAELAALIAHALLLMDPDRERELTFWQEYCRPGSELREPTAQQFATAVLQAQTRMSALPWCSSDPLDGAPAGSHGFQAVRELTHLGDAAERSQRWMNGGVGRAWQEVVEWGSHSGWFWDFTHIRRRNGSAVSIQDLLLPMGQRLPELLDAIDTITRHAPVLAQLQLAQLRVDHIDAWYGPKGAGPALHVAHMLRTQPSTPWGLPDIATALGRVDPEPRDNESRSDWQKRRNMAADALGRSLNRAAKALEGSQK